jgi:hypothetical protein
VQTAMQTYGGLEISVQLHRLPAFSTSALRGGVFTQDEGIPVPMG